MAYNDITNRLENACESLFNASPVTGVTAYRGQDDATRTLPSVIFIAEQGEVYPRYSGNYRMQLRIRVETASSQNLEDHRSYFSQIADKFTDSAIASSLSGAIDDFTAFDVSNERPHHTTEDRRYVSELTLDVYCCATHLV